MAFARPTLPPAAQGAWYVNPVRTVKNITAHLTMLNARKMAKFAMLRATALTSLAMMF